MIVVTGPGRSGTSLLAALYRELGFDPGGGWSEPSRGGFEAREVVRANVEILRDLGLAEPARRFGLLTHLGIPPPVRRVGRRVLPSAIRTRLRSVVKEPPWRRGDRFDLLDWERFEEVVARRGPDLRRTAAALPVAKDPRFCWTLGVWAAAGAPIEHVLIAVRSMEAMVDSRVSVGWLAPRSVVGARNWFAYGLGLCVASCHDHRLPHAVVRYPDFVHDPDVLFEVMRFPREVARGDLARAFERVARPELVRGGR